MICPECGCPMEIWQDDTGWTANPSFEQIDGVEVEVTEWNCPNCEFSDTTYDA